MALKKASAYLGSLDTASNNTGNDINVNSNGGVNDITGDTIIQPNGASNKSAIDKEASAQAANASKNISEQLYHPTHPTTERYDTFNDTADTRGLNVRANANELAAQDLATKQEFKPTDYNPIQEVNVAKGEDPDGQLNGRTFESTMRNSRLADYYNNKPQDNRIGTYSTNPAAPGVTVVETNPRPQINTQEMRQMRENEKLDEQRKAGRINLQNIVDQVPMQDINMYKQQISANTEAVRNLQNQIIASMAGAKAGQESSVNTTEFSQKLAAHIGGRKAQIVMGAISSGDYQVASLLTGIFGGTQTMITPDDFYTGAVQRTADVIATQYGLSYPYVFSMLITNPAGLTTQLAEAQLKM